MVRLSIFAYIMGLVLSFAMFTGVMAQTATPEPTMVEEPTSPPATGYGVK